LRPRASLVVLLVWVGACSLPATTFEAYRSKASDAAEEVVSQARTAILTAHLAGQDRLLGTEVAVQLQNAEAAAASAVESFASVQPPDDRSDRVRARVLPVLRRIADAIARMRFEAARAHTPALLEYRSELIEPTGALERWATANA
jgi:hypothetical protein